MTTAEQLPPDQSDRELIRTALDDNLFVEAGAGAGKTSSLVGRILGLVQSGADIGSIAAITFTEKAAADLRRRLRQQLESSAAIAAGVEHDRLTTALDHLDHAPIGTLHAFARRLLNEFPVQAGLPPGFTVLDELESNLAFEERWDDLLEHLLAEPYPEAGPIAGGVEFVQLCDFDTFGLRRGLRRVAIGFHENWDLVEARVDATAPAEWTPDITALAGRAAEVCGTTTPPDDRQAGRLSEIAATIETMRSDPTTIGRLQRAATIADRLKNPARIGSKAKWKSHGGASALDALRAEECEVRDLALGLLAEARSQRVRLVGAIVGRWVLQSARLRAADGTVEFHDLLVLARRLIATHPTVRSSLHHRYRHLLLDEFQDTDPIQLEIAVRLASAPDDPAHGSDWSTLRPLPGRLFIVGDPKQSIYRFRRADIAQYLRAADLVGARRATLSANFRSSEPVIEWVNHVFGSLIEAQPDAQPEYQPLEPCRAHHLTHGSVHVLGIDEHTDLADYRAAADELRSREASEVADAIATVLHERWQVVDEQSHDLRECRPGDIAILLPARTSLAALEAALTERELPYRAENSSVVYTTTEIRHVMLALRAADDATDELALVAALRTGLYGCSDVELYEWRHGGGSWSIWRDPPDALVDHPVASAICHVRSLAERATWHPPADLIAALVDERRLFDAALDSPDARDVWRRLRYVIEQARSWSDAGGHGLRRYLSWVKLQATESRTADTILPEHDHDAVRIMTIHAAKGLEFPVTVVTGLTTVPRGQASHAVVWHGDSWTIASKEGDEIYDEFQPLDEQMGDAERRRLLYVACTRAVDHLIVSIHRKPVKDGTEARRLTSATLLAQAGAADPTAAARPLTANPGGFVVEQPNPTPPEWADEQEWETERVAALRRAARRETVSATRLADDLASWADPGEADDEGLRKAPVDLDLPPWQRGRYGTAIGRAVHGTLQYCDLGSGSDIAAHAASQCAAEGIIGLESTVADLARSALQAPVVRQALTAEHHRELFVAAEIGGRVLEGYIDLLVRTDDGLLIVDYKTDAWRAGSHRTERIIRYRRQLAAYALALERVVDEPVTGGVLVHCRTDGPADEIHLDGWSAALHELRNALADG